MPSPGWMWITHLSLADRFIVSRHARIATELTKAVSNLLSIFSLKRPKLPEFYNHLLGDIYTESSHTRNTEREGSWKDSASALIERPLVKCAQQRPQLYVSFHFLCCCEPHRFLLGPATCFTRSLNQRHILNWHLPEADHANFHKVLLFGFRSERRSAGQCLGPR